MKKILAIILVLCICAMMTVSCVGRQPSYLKYDSFFEAEKLKEYHLEGLPQPDLDNSVLYNDDGRTLYLNISKEEFSDYLAQLSDYVLSKEDVYYKGIEYTTELAVGPLFLPLGVSVIIPLVDNQEPAAEGECFVFALDDELGTGWIYNAMRDAFFVNAIYSEGKIDNIDFEYTCIIEIGSLSYAKFETCAKEHLYNENVLSYPVPNTDIVIDVFSCDYCGHQEYSDYSYGSGDYTSYSKIIVKGEEYLTAECRRVHNVNPSCYAGLREHIEIDASDEYDYEVLINGFSIPVIGEYEGVLTFGYIFPACDVEIEIIATEKAK